MFHVAFAFFSLGFVFAVVLRAVCLGGLATWAGAVRRIARLMKATRAVVAVATGRVVVSKLPDEERRWFKRLEGQFLATEGRAEKLRGERDEILSEHRLLVEDVRSLTSDLKHAQRERETEARARDASERRLQALLDGIDQCLKIPHPYSGTVLDRVRKCPNGSVDHGLGACGCEVKA